MKWFTCFLLLNALVLCVDRSNFRTCKDSSFCTRQREYWPDAPEYFIDGTSIQASKDSLTLTATSEKNGKNLTITITYHTSSVFRLLLDEANPIRPRYRLSPVDALVQEPIRLPLKVESENDKIIISGSENDKVKVYLKPFSLTFIRNESVLVSINERGLLNLEHQQEKPQGVPAPESEADKATEDEGNKVADAVEGESGEAVTQSSTENPSSVEENTASPETKVEPPAPADWSETFKGHRDSRPYGPTSVGVDVTFHGFEFVYGIPEHADSFALRDTDSTDPYRLYNLDVFEYELYNPMALYGSVPVMWAHRENATAGIFWHNPAETWIDVKSSKRSDSTGLLSKIPRFFSRSESEPNVRTRWVSESGVIDIFVMLADSPSSALRAYASLTGTTRLPPLFALGYHQCRWNYNDEQDVSTVNVNFDVHNLPMDVMWLDIEYADGKRYLKWDTTKFSDPDGMLANLTANDRKLVVVVDPHIKRDGNWDIFRDAESKGMFVKKPDSGDFDGWCWPGSSSWPDFLRPEVENWWADLFLSSTFLREGSMYYVWNDMNEPSDIIHAGQWENRDVHNIFGLLVHRGTWQGILRRSGGKERPFVLTRAFFAGSQRTSAVWTGDNKASWDHLQITVPMLLTLSMTGITFCGADVGGFFGNPSDELMVRWYQAATFQPFFRAHAHMDTKRREPWLVENPDNLKYIRDALRLRYSLLPYWYTLFARSEFDAQPPMAPLMFHFPTDPTTFVIDNEHMVGEALLVHPVVHEGAMSVDVYLPQGTWYLHNDWKVYTGRKSISLPVDLGTIPVFHRGGFIVPKKARTRRSSGLMAHDPYTLVISLAPELSNKATGYLYLDDFHSVDVSTSAKFYRIDYQARSAADPSGSLTFTRLPPPGSKQLAVQPREPEGTVPDIERILFVGFNVQPQRVTVTTSGAKKPRDLEFTYVAPKSADGLTDGQGTGLVVIRKPELHVSEGWKVNVYTHMMMSDEL
ncbi:unnamed protein product [Schistocephalus solidus]|uniref:Glucosidase II subunit alpha n=1 Tax=Schistocephalus solidus TaxID=70667 RepID=A0A183SU93_SCHSO|nr:unnamed protein product [Schistocephalus solidus]